MSEMKDRIIDAALKLSLEIGWGYASLRDIASEADISLSGLRSYFDDKHDILVALGRRIDQKTLENVGAPDPESSAKDRLFDVLMERFDVLNDDREAIIAILDSMKGEPKQALINLPHLCQSMNWMLEAAGIDVQGYKGLAQIAGLNVLYLKAVKTWMEDDAPDMPKTMAMLDKDLSRAEKWLGNLGF